MQINKIKKIFQRYIIFTFSVLLFFSCNITKNIENKKLLSKNKVSIEKKDIKKKELGFEKYEIEQLIKPKPNSKFIGIPVRLWIYNLYTPEKKDAWEKNENEKCIKKNKKKIASINNKVRYYEKELKNIDPDSKQYSKYKKKLQKEQENKEQKENKTCNKKHISNKIGEKPVVFSLNDQYRNPKNIRVFLKNKGYYSPQVNFEIKNKRKNKIVVKYDIFPGEAHKISNIKYDIKDINLSEIIVNDKENSILKIGDRLDIQVIEIERKRISDLLRDIGYYNFSKDYIYFSVDTIGKNKHAEITINISENINGSDEKISHKKHIIQNVFIYPNFKPDDALINKEEYYKNQDTIIFYSKEGKRYNFIYKNFPRINPKSITRGIYVAPDDYFNLKKIKATYKYLASLPIIQTANINFIKSKSTLNSIDSIEYLDCEIKLAQDKLQTGEFTSEFTNTGGNFGIAGNLNYTHNNFFRNTEVLNLKLNGELKRVTKITDSDIPTPTKFFNSKKIGIDLSIQFPRLVAPIPLKKFIIRSNPKTIANVNFNLLDRPDIKWSVAGGAITYSWNSTNTITHSVSPVTADFVKVYRKSEGYQLDESYENRFVFGGAYKFSFNNQLFRKSKNYFYITAYTKAAGNSLTGLMNLFNQEKTDNSYILFGNAFAQFIKTDLDVRYYRKLNRAKDNLVFRVFTGVVLPYGNLNVVPFSERYFSGGANGIRAWEERLLGPGSYNVENADDVPYQRADIKLEGNIEYRMNLFWRLEGALFIDAGNIWSIKKDDVREGSYFEFKDFHKEIAIGSGFGFRLDFDFFIVRLDLGLKLKDPSFPENNRWVPGNHIFTLNNTKFNLGIGYPF